MTRNLSSVSSPLLVRLLALTLATPVFSLSSFAAADARVTSPQELLTSAVALGSGKNLILTHGLSSTADPTVLALTALEGDTTARIVGATDFVATAPNLPGDLEIENISPVPFTTADGSAGVQTSSNRIHPLHTSSQFDRFPGPERALTVDPAKRLPPPFDYDESGAPLGLRVLGAGRGIQHTENHLRHITPHDGHIVWVAEYLMEDGSTQVTWEEVPMTRANCPTFRPRREVVEGKNRATHLRKLVTLEVASAEEMMVKDKADTPDPRRWSLQPKRLRSQYKPHQTLTATDGQISLTEVQQALLAVPIDADGAITGLKPGEDYVIELPPTPIEIVKQTDKGPQQIRLGDDGVAEHLQRLEKNRIFLIGTPGKTIIPALEATLVRNLDFGWITLSPIEWNEEEFETLRIGRETDVRFFGCVIDTVDYSSDGTINLMGGQMPGKPGQTPVRGGWMEFYDGYIGDTEGPTFSYANQKLPFDSMPRLIIARSIIDVSNDGVSFYGQGIALLEGNYWYGGGGRWNEKSGNYQHRDILGQIIPMGIDRIAGAYYNNIISMGKNLVGTGLAMRGSGSLLMYQPSCDYASEYVGNIFENNGHMRGITGMHPEREPVSGKIGSSWGYGMHVAENIIYERPDNISTGWTYPSVDEGSWRGSSKGSMDSWFATNNIGPFLGGKLEITGFQRAVNWLPEENSGWNACWIKVSDYKRGKDTILRPGDVVRGAASGASITVYADQRAGRDSMILTTPPAKSFQSGETMLLRDIEIGTFASITEPEMFKGGRAPYPSPEAAFAKPPAVSGSFQKGYQLDWAPTTYGNTDRAGYVAAEDFEVAESLRRYSTDGQSGGPNIPFHGNYLERFLALPTNFNTDLLGYDQPGSGYPDAWYAQWAPAAFTLKGTFEDPWTPMPGRDQVDLKNLTINTRIAELGTGTLAEEVAADGSFWRLEILEDGTHRPRFTLKDATGTTLYEVTSARPVAANDHLLVGVSTQHRSYGQEYYYASLLWGRWIWNHYVREGKTNDLVLSVHIQPTAPTAPTNLTEDEMFIWIDTSESNRPKIYAGNTWTYLQGDLSECLSTFLLGLAKSEGTYQSRFLGTNTLPTGQFRIYGAPNPEAFHPAKEPRDGDYVIYGKPDALQFNDAGAAYAQMKGGQWEISPRIPFEMANTPHGDVRCYFRIGGRESIRESDWIWSNLQQDLLPKSYGVTSKVSEKKRSQIEPVDAGTTEIVTTFQLLDPAHLAIYLQGPGIARRQLLVLDDDYTVQDLGLGQGKPNARIVFLKPLLQQEGDRVYIEPVIPPAAADAYAWDAPIPRGLLKLGASAEKPFTGTVNYFEARRQRGHANEHQSLEIPATGLQHRFARQPIDPASGRRDTPLLGPADVWLTAENQ